MRFSIRCTHRWLSGVGLIVADVFISYSHAHTDLTERLAALLAREGYTVWWDVALESWQEFQATIDAEIKAAKVIVVIWSPGAAASLYVKAEANKAIGARKLVNARAPDFPFSAIPTPYNAMHIDEPDLDEPHRLLKSIRSVWAGKPYDATNKPLHEHYAETFGVSLFDPKREGASADPANLAPSELLQARREIVPFIDAPLQLAAEMARWCTDAGRATAGRLIHGAGGFGKTRLMIEVAKRLRARDWLAGFVQPVRHAGDLQEARQREQAFEQLLAFGDEPGVLLVFDYAEGRQDEVAALTALLRDRKATRPVRIVLLARGDQWWEVFYEQRDGARSVFGAAGYTLGDVRRLSEIPKGQARLDFFNGTVEAFQPIMAQMAAAGRFPGFDPDRTPAAVLTNRLIVMMGSDNLSQPDDYVRPLAIQMEALLYLASASPAPGSMATADLLREVLNLEEKHWAKLLGDVPQPLDRDPDRKRDLARGVAQVTAVQGVGGTAPITGLLMADGFYAGRRNAAVDVDRPRRDLARIYGRGEAVAHLEPDLIGEHLVAGTADPALIDGCLAWIAALPVADQSKRYTDLATVLIRATRDEHGPRHVGKAVALLDHLIKHHPALLDLLTHVGATTPGRWLDLLDGPALAAIDDALPMQSLARMDFSLAVADRRLSLARKMLAAAGAADADALVARQSDVAARVTTLGNRLSDLGRREDALTASQEAVDIRRALAKDRPDAFLPDLASSLGALSQSLAGAERQGEAAAAAREGLALIAPFVAAQAEAFGGLARALVQLHSAACKAAGTEPDGALLQRVARALGEAADEPGDGAA
jgi:TIR domain